MTAAFGNKNDPNAIAKPGPDTPPSPVEKPPQGGKRHLDKNGKLIINQEGLEQAKHFEGCYLKAYIDPVGVPTIGYGRIVYPDGRKVRMGDTCTQAQADAWLIEDLYGEGAKYVRAFLDDSVERELSDDQFSALCSFTFNRGAGRFRDYVAVFLNRRDFTGAINSLVSINWAGADRKYLLGLDRRRWAERLLWEGKDWRAVDTVKKFQDFKARGYRA